MIAVAAHDVTGINQRPVFEIEMIVVGILRNGPAVEHFIHNQKAHAVAQVEKLRRRRIVGGADSVDAKLPEQLESARPHTERHGGAERAAVVMHCNAFELEVAAVEPEARRRIEMVFAYAEGSRLVINGGIAGADLRDGALEGRMIDVPDLRRSDEQVSPEIDCLSCGY